MRDELDDGALLFFGLLDFTFADDERVDLPLFDFLAAAFNCLGSSLE